MPDLTPIPTQYNGHLFRRLQREVSADTCDPFTKLRLSQDAFGDVALLTARTDIACNVAERVVDAIDTVAKVVAVSARLGAKLRGRWGTAVGAILRCQIAKFFDSQRESIATASGTLPVSAEELIECRFSGGQCVLSGTGPQHLPEPTPATLGVSTREFAKADYALVAAVADATPEAVFSSFLADAFVLHDGKATVSLPNSVYEWLAHDTPRKYNG